MKASQCKDKRINRTMEEYYFIIQSVFTKILVYPERFGNIFTLTDILAVVESVMAEVNEFPGTSAPLGLESPGLIAIDGMGYT